MILLAEPEEAIRESVEIVLTEEGFDCHAIEDTDSLLRAIHLHESDLIIADINTIYSDAHSVISALKQYPDIFPPILVTLTYERIRDMLPLIKFGIGEYLLKPFHFEDLIDRIHRIIPSPKS